jgi:hypothetical protein
MDPWPPRFQFHSPLDLFHSPGHSGPHQLTGCSLDEHGSKTVTTVLASQFSKFPLSCHLDPHQYFQDAYMASSRTVISSHQDYSIFWLKVGGWAGGDFSDAVGRPCGRARHSGPRIPVTKAALTTLPPGCPVSSMPSGTSQCLPVCSWDAGISKSTVMTVLITLPLLEEVW